MPIIICEAARPNTTDGLCECGCGTPAPVATQSHRRHGWVKGKPMRFCRGHNNRGRAIKGLRYAIEDHGYATPCWIWQMSIHTATGYGKLKRNGRQVLAHRVVYEALRGAIPGGLTLDHLCRNPPCVNPDHLEPVTHAENMWRGRGTKVTPEEMRDIIIAPGPAWAIAEKYGLSVGYVQHIRAGRMRPKYLDI